MRGRKAEPLEKKVAKGARGAATAAKSAPARVESNPQPPEWLKDHALTCWNRVSNILFMRGQLSADSEIALLGLSMCYAEWVELAHDLHLNGRFQKVMTKAAAMTGNEDGESAYMERARPSLAAFQDCDRRLKNWLVEFGLTDASRSKVTVGAPEAADEDDPLARYGLN
jgi:P27 family predicted phage terminase small subunit